MFLLFSNEFVDEIIVMWKTTNETQLCNLSTVARTSRTNLCFSSPSFDLELLYGRFRQLVGYSEIAFHSLKNCTKIKNLKWKKQWNLCLVPRRFQIVVTQFYSTLCKIINHWHIVYKSFSLTILHLNATHLHTKTPNSIIHKKVTWLSEYFFIYLGQKSTVTILVV